MDLHNQLKIADIRLITILVGQPELLTMKNDLRSSRQKHLLGRFMTATHQFEGVIGKQDFRRMNRALDSGSEYPDGSGCSYTRYFIPKAFGSGWRLLKHSDSIWKVLIEACRSEGIRKFKELPMQPLTALLRWLLQSLAEIDDVNLDLHRPLIEEAVYRVAISQIEDLVGRIED